MIPFEALLTMGSAELHEVMIQGHPLDEAALADTQYLGVDLSLPPWMGKLLWKTFRKTFHQDPALGVLRGWNVRMEQTGVDGPAIPMKDREGQERTFGHYRVKRADGEAWPRGWQGAHFLDYGDAGNPFFDLARLGYTPLVAVNPGDMDLLLGWEIFKIAGVKLPLSLYWLLKRQGPLDAVAPVP